MAANEWHSPAPVYALDVKGRPNTVAVASFIDGAESNFIALVGPCSTGQLVTLAKAHVQYPVTRIRLAPQHDSPLLITASDSLRLWQHDEATLTPRSNLHNAKSQAAPLTSFDWSTVNPAQVITSSLDNTCACWNIERGRIVAQLLSHDCPVYDVSWSPVSPHNFISVGADGSAREFDLRSLAHSTVVYESSPSANGKHAASPEARPPSPSPLVRVAYNPQQSHQVALLPADSSEVLILDLRNIGSPVTRLQSHTAPINAMAFANNVLGTGSDDSLVLVWDLEDTQPTKAPKFVHYAGRQVNSLAWAQNDPELMALAFGNTVRCLTV